MSRKRSPVPSKSGAEPGRAHEVLNSRQTPECLVTTGVEGATGDAPAPVTEAAGRISRAPAGLTRTQCSRSGGSTCFPAVPEVSFNAMGRASMARWTADSGPVCREKVRPAKCSATMPAPMALRARRIGLTYRSQSRAECGMLEDNHMSP